MKTAHSSTSNSSGSITGSTLVRGVALLVFIFLILWFIPRFFPLDFLCKRGLECALLYPEIEAPFRANVSIHRESVCGDLIALSGREEFCVPRKENFETDSFGFRNLNAVKADSSPYILLGDSFAFGQGLDQTEMPSVAISQVLGRPVYNGAGKLDLESILLLSKRAGPGKTFIYLDLDRSERNPSQLSLSDKGEFHRKWKPIRETFKNYNPLKIILTRLSHLFFDRFLPEKPSAAVVALPLRESKWEYLFLTSSVGRGKISREWAGARTEYFVKLNTILKDQGQNLFVVLVPEKSTVYLTEERDRGIDLDHLAKEFQLAGVPALSLATRFLKDVENVKEPTDPLYFRDDTHWAANGVRHMADEIKLSLKFPKN